MAVRGVTTAGRVGVEGLIAVRGVIIAGRVGSARIIADENVVIPAGYITRPGVHAISDAAGPRQDRYHGAAVYLVTRGGDIAGSINAVSAHLQRGGGDMVAQVVARRRLPGGQARRVRGEHLAGGRGTALDLDLVGEIKTGRSGGERRGQPAGRRQKPRAQNRREPARYFSFHKFTLPWPHHPPAEPMRLFFRPACGGHVNRRRVRSTIHRIGFQIFRFMISDYLRLLQRNPVLEAQ